MLRFNERENCFFLITNEMDRAEAAGLTLSTDIRGPNGEYVYYTSDHSQKPVFNPYAVLEFFEEANDPARNILKNIKKDYELSWAEDYSIDIPTRSGLECLPYQKAGVAYALNHKNCIIADEPGLGKTIQAICVANCIDARKILVLCPASIRRHWRSKIYEWSTSEKLSVECIEKSSKGFETAPHNYFVCSYDLARNQNIHIILSSVDWDLIICDEAHYLKTSTAIRTRALFGGGERNSFFYNNGLVSRAKRVVALTGTPLPNRPREAYTLARGLDWGSIDYLSHDAFLYRYNPSVRMASGHNIELKGRLPELNARLRSNIMIRRLKRDVLRQLPDKRYEMTYLGIDGNIAEILAKEALIDFNPNDLFNPDFSLNGTPIATLRREMGEAMVPQIVEYTKYLLDIVEIPKIILVAHHTSVIYALAEALQKYHPALHRGGISDKAKEQAKIDVIAGKSRILLGQLDTMEGIDGLQTVTADVVFGEPAWNPGRNEQVVDRAHRHGQHSNVVAHFLLVEGSFNEKVLNIVLNKTEDIHASLDRRLI